VAGPVLTALDSARPAWVDGGVALLVFVVAVSVSLGASAAFVVRVERIARRLRLTPGALGLLVALGADAPEITASVSALARHDHTVGIGVAIGSNVFNLASLIGFAAVVAGRLDLDRRLALVELVPSLALALLAGAALDQLVAPALVLALVVVVLAPVVALAFVSDTRRRVVLGRAGAAIEEALSEEEREIAAVVDQGRATKRDVLEAFGLVLAVVVASTVMEQRATSLGARWHLPALLVGGVVLAAVTSIPNAIGAYYLARRKRPGALLAEASNSNAFNVLFGFALPALVAGYGAPSSASRLIAASYLVLVVVAYGAIAWQAGLRRSTGWVVLAGYGVFLALAVALG